MSGRAKSTLNSWATCLAETQSGPQEATIVLPYSLSTDLATEVRVKATQTMTQYYSGKVTISSGVTFAQIWRSSLSTVPIASTVVDAALGSTITLRLVYNSGQLFLYVNGTLCTQVADSNYGANIYCGFYVPANSTGLDSFSTAGVSAATFTVLPSAAQSNGPPLTIYMSGTNTSWTPGQPGSPSFTVSAGSLSDQVVTSATSAFATFTPPTTAQTVTVTDPSTELTAPIYCAPNVPPGGGSTAAFPLSNEAVTMINNTPESEGGLLDKLLKPSTPMHVDTETTVELETLIGGLSISTTAILDPASVGTSPTGLLADVIRYLINGQEITPGENVFSFAKSAAADALAAHYAVDDLTVAGTLTLQSIITALAGLDSRDLTELYDAILAVTAQAENNGDAIAGLRGNETATVAEAVALLEAIRTGSSYDLADVQSWVAAVGTSVGNLAVDVANLQASLNNGVQSILDAIDAIEPGGATAGAPIWPGVEGVTFGASVALAGQVSIDAPMDGVRVVISAVDQGTLFYRYGDQIGYRKIGALTFVNDNGDCELFQALNFEQAFYVPKTMLHASGVRLFTQHVASGTVQPWTVST